MYGGTFANISYFTLVEKDFLYQLHKIQTIQKISTFYTGYRIDIESGHSILVPQPVQKVSVLDVIVNMNLLFTLVVFISLTWDPGDSQNRLNSDSVCAPTRSIIENPHHLPLLLLQLISLLQSCCTRAQARHSPFPYYLFPLTRRTQTPCHATLPYVS